MFYAVSSDHSRSGGNILVGGTQDNDPLFDNFAPADQCMGKAILW